jgi:hypothetical protein
MMTASSPTKSNTNEFDDLLGVPFNLVHDGVDLSKHCSSVLSQSFEEIFAAKELLPIISELNDNALAQGKAI